MVWRIGRVLAGELLSRFGWLLAGVGVVIVGMQAYDRMTTEPAVATITDIKPLCQRQDGDLGKGRWRKINCAELETLRAAGAHVRSKPYARLGFTGADGRARDVWVNFGKLELKTANVGDRIEITYRGGKKKPYVTPALSPLSPQQLLLGPACGLAGLILIVLARRFARASDGDSNSDSDDTTLSPSPTSTRAPVPTPWGAPQSAAGQRRYATPRPAPSSSSPQSVRNYQPPQRAGAVQRNRGWFG